MRVEKNNIPFWINLKFSIYSSIGFVLGTLLLGFFLYVFIFNEIDLVRFFSMLSITSIFLGTLSFFLQVISIWKRYGPRYIEITHGGVVCYFSERKKDKISMERIYGISEKDEVCIPEGFFKCKKTKEYRVYYYKGNKLKWFCVSEEVGNKIISMWEEWKKEQGSMNAKKP